MATSRITGVIQHLRRTALLRDGAGLTDGQLLEDYLSSRDEAPLAALVRRHGPMVWGVCRRVLSNHHDAEDAFQATFLVLVRKAASIVPKELVGNWLYGVAYQTAMKARATVAKRKTRERQVAEMPERAAAEQDVWRDLQPLLDQELSRLPDRYRAVLVLCDLEGKTRKQAAQQLGCPEGTVAGQLARARVMLAKRLARHGLAVSGGALAAMLSQCAASASVPSAVMCSTINAASLFAAGQAAASALIPVKVVALAEGVLKTMLFTKLKVIVVLLLVVATLSGAAGLIYQTLGAEPPKAQAATDQTDKQKQPARKEDKPKSDEERLQGDDIALGGDYSKDKITAAGKHCVHGYWVNERTVLFYAADTAQLNRDLRKYREWQCSKRKVVIHVGTKRAKSPWDTKEPDTFADWSVNTWDPPADATKPVPRMPMEMHIDIWLGSKITLEDLRIPEGFEVISGGEIEKFIQKRKQESK